MGYLLLGLEWIAALVLLAAWAVGDGTRLRRHPLLTVLQASGAWLLFALAVGGVGWWEWSIHLSRGNFPWLLLCALASLAGVAAVLIRGWFAGRQEPDPVEPPAWPRWVCGAAAGGALLLCLLTFWNLDQAVQQRLEAVRHEAAVVALSIAPPRVADRDNAAVVYELAFARQQAAGEWPPGLAEVVPPGIGQQGDLQALNRPDAAAYLARQAGAAELFRLAAERPACNFDRDFARPSVMLALPELQQMRDGARLLAAEALWRATRRDDLPGAMANIGAMVTMAEHAAEDGVLISLLVGAAIEHMAFATLEACLAGRPPDAAETAAHDRLPRFEFLASHQRRMQRALRMEEAFGLATFASLGGGQSWETMFALSGDGADDAPLRGLVRPGVAIFRVFLLERDLAAYRLALAEMTNLSGQPLFKSESTWTKLEDSHRRQRTGVLTSMLIPAVSSCRKATARADAYRGCAQVALAVRRYSAAHGQPPANLDALVPDHLDFVPLDPFDGQPLRFRQRGGGWVVYSVGQDRQDDQGRPLDGARQDGDIAFRCLGPPAPAAEPRDEP